MVDYFNRFVLQEKKNEENLNQYYDRSNKLNHMLFITAKICIGHTCLAIGTQRHRCLLLRCNVIFHGKMFNQLKLLDILISIVVKIAVLKCNSSHKIDVYKSKCYFYFCKYDFQLKILIIIQKRKASLHFDTHIQRVFLTFRL